MEKELSNNKLTTQETLSFEEALAQLEKEVAILESGEVSLDAAMKAFSRGTELARLCQTKLDEAEKQITILVSDGKQGTKEEPFPEI